MGIEALAQVALRSELCKQMCKDEELADKWGIARAGAKWRSLLLAECRKRVLFQGDIDCYKKAKSASDGLEHGFMDLGEIHGYASSVRQSTARYLRSAIIELSDVNDAAKEVLQSAKYLSPLESWQFTKNLRGWLIADHDQLAAPDQLYPRIAWESSYRYVRLNEHGEVDVGFDENLRVIAGPGVGFEPSSLFLHAPTKTGIEPGTP
jgi:hypothetical protein